jgi:hypothetical protein
MLAIAIGGSRELRSRWAVYHLAVQVALIFNADCNHNYFISNSSKAIRRFDDNN